MKNRLPLLLTTFFMTCAVFAQSLPSYEAVLPLFDKERQLGEVKVKIEGEKLISIDKASLINALRSNLQQDTLRQFESLGANIDPTTMPLPLRFNPEDLKLEMPFDVELRSQEKVALVEDYHRRYEGEALKPAPFGGAINSRLEQTWSNNPAEDNYFNGQFDSFLNLNSLVLENQSYYQSNIDQKYFRGDTRLVKDFEKQQIRFQAGDIHPQIQGFMVGRPLGGVNFSRNFSLNPYRLPYPSGSQDFVLQSRSLVKYFVNGTMIKSEYLPAGNYTAKDIPLNNGMNVVMIEATDDLGQKKVFVFKTAASINLLNEGESRFDVSFGTPFIDQNFKREYREEDGNLLSSFFQYGFNSAFSASLYGQGQKNHSLLGTELIKATTLGNFGAGYARSHFGTLDGDAQSLNYQYLGSGNKWYFSHSLGARYEHRAEDFRTSILDAQSAVKNVYALNYALPVAGYMTLAMGANYGDVRNNDLNDRYGFDTTLNFRMFNRHNLALFVGRTRDENRNWNDIAYAFLTITFPDSNDFVSTFYDQKQKNSKLTYTHDNQNRLYSPKAQAIVENHQGGQLGEADMLVPTPVADFGARINGTHDTQQDRLFGRGSVRMNSAIVFAQNDGDWGLGLARPVPSSFVIFKPEDRLKDQKIALKSTSPYTEAQTGLLGEITFANLLPYQYREIQLDPTLMDEGRTLKKEKYVLYPTYRSAHIVRLEDKGAVMLRGFLMKENGKPWELQVGHAGDKPFFTNRDGEFFIEGLEAGTYRVKLDGIENEVQITVSEDDKGIKNIGTLVLPEEE